MNYWQMVQIILSIEGNIGAGKTTLLNHIRDRYGDIKVIEEPVSTWSQYTTSDGKDLISHFYEDMDRWSYTFQNAAILTRIINIKKALRDNPQTKIFITERSTQTDKYIFASMLYRDGKINDMEMKLYDTWYENFAKDIPIQAIIWIPTDVDTCVERIKKRGRPGEDNISRVYLENLDRVHKDWLGCNGVSSDGVPVKILHTTEELDSILKEYSKDSV
jgi:deoxyadenosine/deoxycytidine kinase